VGENPLPVYLAIRQLTTPDAQIWLVHSPGPRGTEQAARRIEERLCSAPDCAGATRACVKMPLHDPYSPAAVREVMDGLCPRNGQPIALNYTGGTKVMSAFSVLAWGNHLPHVWYLEEASGRFHSGTGATEALGAIGMTVRELCALHDITIRKDESWPPDFTPDDLKAVYRKWTSLKPKARPKFGWGEDFEGSRIEEDFNWYCDCRDAFGQCLGWLTEPTRRRWRALKAPQDAASYAGSQCQRVFEFFAKHQWLEYVVREAALSIPADPARYVFGQRPANPLVAADDILFSQEFVVGDLTPGKPRDPKMFEGDMLAVVGNRLRYISVTTSARPADCKEKMFEAMHRSRQVGGDLATSCVASMTWAVNDCRNSVDEHPRHTIYGKRDLDSWLINPASLRDFLTRDFR
jgi:hypothetical protein